MTRGSLRFRLFLAGIASIAVALCLSGVGLRALFERHAERSVVAEMAVTVDTLATGLDRAEDGSLILAAPLRDARFDRPLSGFYWQIGPADGAPFLRSRSLWDATLPLPPDELSEGAVHTHRVVGPGSVPLVVAERLVTLPARLGGEKLRVAVGRNAADIERAARDFTADLVPFLLLIGILLLGAAATQVAVGLAPLAAIRQRLAAINSGKATRIGADFPDEVQPLALEVDALLEQRERDIATANARAADLAHGLKTPLQVLAGETERLRRAGAQEAATALDELGTTMRRHVERELARVRLAGRSGDDLARVRDIVERIVRVLRRTPRGERLNWSIDGRADLAAAIHPDDLAEALGAVMENAARFAASSVRIRISSASDQTSIAIIDDGPGIPEERRAEALSRGGRLDATGPGTGLGLAIARDAVEARGGQIVLGPTAPGAMTVTLVLPAKLTKR